MKLIYRLGTIEDKAILQELGLMTYSQYQFAMTPENWIKFHSTISNPDTYTQLMNTSICFLCEYNKQIIGMAFLVSNGHPTELFDKKWSYIRMVGVNPKFEGNGIAKKLTQICIDYAIETNEQFIALHTSEFMNAARHIYENFGFKKVKEIICYDKKYWIYLLELNSQKNDGK